MVSRIVSHGCQMVKIIAEFCQMLSNHGNFLKFSQILLNYVEKLCSLLSNILTIFQFFTFLLQLILKGLTAIQGFRGLIVSLPSFMNIICHVKCLISDTLVIQTI